jgi:hypothetical protein
MRKSRESPSERRLGESESERINKSRREAMSIITHHWGVGDQTDFGGSEERRGDTDIYMQVGQGGGVNQAPSAAGPACRCVIEVGVVRNNNTNHVQLNIRESSEVNHIQKTSTPTPNPSCAPNAG